MNNWPATIEISVIAVCVAVYYVMKLRRPSVASEIEKLAGLKAKGLLTDEEFEEQKRKLLEG